jgi:hypothetical protein
MTTAATYHDRMTEKQLMQTIIEAAQHLGWSCYHTFDSRRSTPGFPDIIAVRPPRVIAIETKAKGGRLAQAQIVWLDDLNRSGIPAYVVYPRDLDWCLEVLR